MSTTNQHNANIIKITNKPEQLPDHISGRVEPSEKVLLHVDQQSEMLKQNNEMIQTLLHDLKNPLSIIYGSACLLQQQEDLPASHKKEAVKSILESVQDMRKLISDWLNLSKIEDGKRELKFETLPFFHFVGNCVNSFSDLAAAKNIKLTFSAIASEEEIEFDHDRMIQAINNLISNAIKYTPDGGEVSILGEIESDNVIVKISDTGIGIEEEEFSQIFDRFYRTQRSTQSKVSGTGLGLAICKAIIERHRGTIEVASVPEKGTTFTVKLPCQQGANTA